MVKRRTFLKQSGLAFAATTLIPSTLFSCQNNRSIGLQLYSLRESIAQDVKGTIEKVAQVGIKEVETYGYSPEGKFWGLEIKEFKKILDDNGLITPAGHYGFDPFLEVNGTKDDLKYSLDVAKELNQNYIVISHIAENLRTSIEDYKRLADKINVAGEICKDAGLKLAYHNHAFEFTDYNGQNGYEIFLKNTDKELVDFEMDIYWVVRAGKDPVTFIKKYPGRFSLWHVKDMNKENPEMNTEIGSGSIDFEEIFKYRKRAGVKHLIIEQENFEMPPFQSLSKSFSFLQNKLQTG